MTMVRQAHHKLTMTLNFTQYFTPPKNSKLRNINGGEFRM